jgi:hypothetical protein
VDTIIQLEINRNGSHRQYEPSLWQNHLGCGAGRRNDKQQSKNNLLHVHFLIYFTL